MTSAERVLDQVVHLDGKLIRKALKPICLRELRFSGASAVPGAASRECSRAPGARLAGFLIRLLPLAAQGFPSDPRSFDVRHVALHGREAAV